MVFDVALITAAFSIHQNSEGHFSFHYLKIQNHKRKASTINLQFLLILSAPLDKRWWWQKVNFVFFCFFFQHHSSIASIHPQQFTVMSWKPTQWQPLRISAKVIQNPLAVGLVCSSPQPSGHFPLVATEPVQPKHDQIERKIQHDRGLLKCTLPTFTGQQQPSFYPTNLKVIGFNCEAWCSLPQCFTSPF